MNNATNKIPRMRNYTIACVSGAVVLVSGEDESQVETEWDAEVKAGNAEPRISGTTEPATPADVRRCVKAGHDYR